MTMLGPSPLIWLPFDAAGAIRADWPGPDPRSALQAALAAPGITDLVVMAHGWQNDLPVAERLYATLWGNSCPELIARGIDPAGIVVAGLLWPAKRWDADYDGAHALDVQAEAAATLGLDDLGGAGGDGLPADVDPATFEAGLALLHGFVDAPAADAIAAAARTAAADPSPEQAERLFATAKAALGWDDPAAAPDRELRDDAARFADTDRDNRAQDLLGRFSGPIAIGIDPAAGGALGLGAVVRSTWQGARNGILWVLNKLTYYTMKKRAGIVGEALARDLLAPLAVPPGLRIHLIGHSFGGRLATAAAAALVPPAGARFGAVVLLQAAYSHNGLAAGEGPFAALIGKPEGPILFTHTHNDLACSVAYPLASRVTGDTAKALGDALDPFGAMGANGPQKLAADQVVVCDPATLALSPGKINTVLADAFVVKTAETDAHNNVTNARCGALVAAALACR